MIESLRGRALAQAGEPDRAEAVQRALLRDHPERLEVRFELAEALSVRGRPAEAAELLAEAPEEQSASPELRRRRAIAALLAGDLEQAQQVASRLVAELPENSTVRLLAATVERADGRWQQVADLIAPVATRTTATEATVSLYVEALERQGRVDAALAFLDERRAVQERSGRPDDAVSSGLQAADLALRNDRIEEAERRARAVALLPPGDEETERLRGHNVAWLLSDCGMAREDWGAAREPLVGLSLPAARARLYEIASRSNDTVSALSLRTGLERGGGDEILALAEADLRLERYADAAAQFRRLTEADPASLRARFGLATSLERLGNLPESEAEFSAILARYPDHAPSLNYLGYMWIERSRNLETAVAMVTRAVRADPSNAAYVDSLGWGLYRLGRAAEAAQLLERAARLEPDDATILEHLGDAWVAAGDFARARAAYERALAVSGAGAALSEKLARLPGAGGAS
jgi:predicted Zn-dependent protease